MQHDKEEFGPAELDDYLNNMNVRFYLALCVPLTLFIIVFIDAQEKGIHYSLTNSVGHYIVAIACVAIWYVGAHHYHKAIKTAQRQAILTQKLLTFRKAAMAKYIAGSGGCVLAVSALYFTQDQVFLFAFGALLVLFSINRPTPYRIIKDLKLDKEERKVLREYRKHL